VKNEKRSLDSDLIICELCSRAMSPKLFYEHLSEHTIEEVQLLKKLSKKTMKMTTEEYKDFFRNLEIESYQRAKQAIEEKGGE